MHFSVMMGKINFFSEFSRGRVTGWERGIKWGKGKQKNFKNSIEFQRKGLLYEKIGVNCPDPRTV